MHNSCHISRISCEGYYQLVNQFVTLQRFGSCLSGANFECWPALPPPLPLTGCSERVLFELQNESEDGSFSQHGQPLLTSVHACLSRKSCFSWEQMTLRRRGRKKPNPHGENEMNKTIQSRRNQDNKSNRVTQEYASVIRTFRIQSRKQGGFQKWILGWRETKKQRWRRGQDAVYRLYITACITSAVCCGSFLHLHSETAESTSEGGESQ